MGLLNSKFTGVGSDNSGDEQECSCSSTFELVQALRLKDFYIANLAWGKALALLIELKKLVLYEDNLTARKRHEYTQTTLIKGKHYFSATVRLVLVAHCFNGTIK